MNSRIALPLLSLTVLFLGFSASAEAQALRTWVSGVGDDVNPCSRTAPCKTFAGAISKTAAGGEISVLDPLGAGAVTITKSITINGDGALASILATGTNGITINNAGAHVVIRNLSIVGAANSGATHGLTGIRVVSAASVHLQDLTITAFDNYGVETVAPVNLTMKNVSVTNGILGGVKVATTSGRSNVTLNHVNIRQSGNAVEASATSSGVVALQVTDSQLNQNTGFGILSSGAASVLVDRSTLNQNSVAAQAGTGSTIRLSDNNVFDNLTGFGCGGGTLASVGDNRKGGNTGGMIATCAPTQSVTVQ